MRRLVRTGLELEGYLVLEAASVAQARVLLHDLVIGVVLDRHLPDGDGISLLDDVSVRCTDACVVVHSDLGAPAGVLGADKGDVNAILDLLEEGAPAPTRPGDPASAVAEAVRTSAADILALWCELCRWDPELPPDDHPTVAEWVITAISDALERPQPLGWGLDPALEPVAEAIALNAPTLDVAMSQLVCLREAFERQMGTAFERQMGTAFERQMGTAFDADPPETNRRLNMIVLRMMSAVARFAVAQLQADAFSDPLTGLYNRRAFELDLEREKARARRHGRPLALAVVDLDHLKQVNDARGHQAGDTQLRAIAAALRDALRREDAAYRIGGDEFAVLFPDTVLPGRQFLLDRLHEAGAPACSVGVASHPEDPLDELVTLADSRLYAWRRTRSAAG